MKARFYNSEQDVFEITDTDYLENDSGEPWTEELLISYIKDSVPGAVYIEIILEA